MTDFNDIFKILVSSSKSFDSPTIGVDTTNKTPSTVDILKDIPYRIPPQTYRPEFKVVIDFTSTFTVDSEASKKAQEATGEKVTIAQPLIDEAILIANARKLARFWSYYFNFTPLNEQQLNKIVQQNGVNNSDTTINKIGSAQASLYNALTDITDGESANLFINKFIRSLPKSKSYGENHLYRN